MWGGGGGGSTSSLSPPFINRETPQFSTMGNKFYDLFNVSWIMQHFQNAINSSRKKKTPRGEFFSFKGRFQS